MNKRRALPTVSLPALAVCVLTLAGLVATAQSTADLSGRWGSNIGLTYTITQSGTQWTWTDNNGVTGTITPAASGLTTNWTDATGPHSATGVITESDATGRPRKIEWNNGVVFLRQPEQLTLSRSAREKRVFFSIPATKEAAIKSPGAAALPDLAGTWGSNLGVTYTITQSGTQCTWTDNSGVTGTITPAASGLTTNWTDASGPHSATGVITESDATGRPRTISWSNGVVFQRGSATKVTFTPIQLPAPQGPPASQATDDWSQGRNFPSPSPSLLTQVAAPMTRRAMIQTLSASPETRAALEQMATSAGTTVSLLTVQMLGGTQAADAPISPYFPPAQALLDLWKAPVHFSPNVPGPVYQVGGSARVVGRTEAVGIYVCPNNSLQMMTQKDFFMVQPHGLIFVDMELPPGGGQYMLAIQAVDIDGTAIEVDWPVADAFVATPTSTDKLSFVKNSANTALVGLFFESPANEGWPAGSTSNMAHRSIFLQIEMTKWGYFAGVTVTRL